MLRHPLDPRSTGFQYPESLQPDEARRRRPWGAWLVLGLAGFQFGQLILWLIGL